MNPTGPLGLPAYLVLHCGLAPHYPAYKAGESLSILIELNLERLSDFRQQNNIKY
jgi:hypothetical protein